MTVWLIDKSALVRLGSSPDADEWANRIERGLVRLASVTRLEVGFSARSAGDLQELVETAPVSHMSVEYMTPQAEDRAMEVQRQLAESGHHRAASIPDVLIAAVAEIAGLVVLHVDKDFELIANVTGQRVERLALAS